MKEFKLVKSVSWFTILLLILAFLILVVLAIAPNIATSYINKNGKELSGRKLYIEDIDVNYFTASITIDNFLMYEANEKDTFCSFQQAHINTDFLKTLFQYPSIYSISIIRPTSKIIQSPSQFNFDDLIEFHNSDTTTDTSNEEPLKYNIENIRIIDAGLSYEVTELKSTIGINNIDIDIPVVSSEEPEISIKLLADFLHGGNGSIDMKINVDNGLYMAKNEIEQLHLGFLEPILKGYLNINSFNGFVNSKMKLSGNYIHTDTINVSGDFQVYDFEIKDSTNASFVKLGKVDINIDTIRLAESIFDFGTVLIDSSHILYESYPNGSNYDLIMGNLTDSSSTAENSVAEVADGNSESTLYDDLAKEFRSYFTGYEITEYDVEKFSLLNSSFFYNDYTLEELFNYSVDDISANGHGLRSKSDRINLDISCTLNNSGNLIGTLALNPMDFLDFELNYTIENFHVEDFTHHSNLYVAHPILTGDMHYDCQLIVKDGLIQNENKLRIESFNFGKKDNKDALYSLPVRLAASLLKDNKGVINLDIPVSGDLNDPDFSIWNTIWMILKNLIVKVATAPYKLVAGFFDGNESSAKEFEIEYGSGSVDADKTISGISKLMESKPELKINFIQVADSVEEVNLLAIRSIKKQYLSQKLGSDSVSSGKIDSLSVFDSTFVEYLNSRLSTTDTITPPQQKCIQLSDMKTIGIKVQNLKLKRNQDLLDQLRSSGANENMITIRNAFDSEVESENNVPKYVLKYDVDATFESEHQEAIEDAKEKFIENEGSE